MSFATANRPLRKPITVGIWTAVLTNYQLNMAVNYASGMASDFSDLIFESSSDVNLPYWIESKTDGVSANVWVKIPTTSTTVTQTIYMYYGIGTTTSPSNIDNVMDAGLTAYLYDGTGFNTYLGYTQDTSPSYDWGSGTVSINGIGNQSDTCSVFWKGWVKPDGLGNTVFYVSSDDGQRLYLNGTLVIDNWVDQGTTEKNYTFNMQGITAIQYNFYENGGGAVAKIGWDSVNNAKVYPIASTFTRCAKYTLTIPSTTFGSEESLVTTNYLTLPRRNRKLGYVVPKNINLENGLVSYYRFEDNLIDIHNDNNGFGSGIAYSTGISGNGLSIDATTDYVSIKPVQTSTITTSLWYYYSEANAGNWNTVLCRNGGNYHHILINGDTRIIGFYNAGWYPSSLTMTTGNWYHILMEKVGTIQKIYVNNSLVLDSTSSFDNAFYPLSIIGNYYSLTPSQGAKGIIDELSIWNRVLSSDEKEHLYNYGKGRFYDFNETTRTSRRKSDLTPVNKSKINYFTPLSISGCKLWIDVSQAPVVADGTSISSLTDLSGTGNNLSQISASQNPKYYSNVLNGLPVIRHSASAQSTWSIPWTYAAPNTFFYVAKLGTTKARLLSGRSNNWLLGVWGGYKNQMYCEGWVGANSDSVADTNLHLWFGIVGSGGYSYLWDGSNLVKSGTGGVTAPNGLCIGYQGTSEFSDGDIGEILGFNRALNDWEYYQIFNYLKAKWGIA